MSVKKVENTIKLCRFFLYEINKNMQKKPGKKTFCKFAGMTSLRQIQNFQTDQTLHKTLYQALSP